jgi:hypothetical protein
VKQGLVLVDTCAWIDFFRNASGVLGSQLAKLIETDRAAITGVVVAELLQGSKTDKERQTLEFVFASVAYLNTEEQDWRDAGLTMRELRQKGITLPLSDAIIAMVAKRHEATILSIDKHFQQLPVALYPD